MEGYSRAYSLPVVVEEVVMVVGDEDGDGVPDDIDACPGTPMGIAVDERGCWALSNALLFEFDSAVIKKENYYILDYLKEAFDAYPNMKVEVDGYTDSTGPDAYNMGLSKRRANAVMNYLINNVGIDAGRLTAVDMVRRIQPIQTIPKKAALKTEGLNSPLENNSTSMIDEPGRSAW